MALLECPQGHAPARLDAAGRHARSAQRPQELPLAAIGVEHLAGGRRRHNVVGHRLHPLPQLAVPGSTTPRPRSVDPPGPAAPRACAPAPRGSGTPRRLGPWPRGPHSAPSSGSPLRRRPELPRRPPGATEASSNAAEVRRFRRVGPEALAHLGEIATKFHVSLPCGRRRGKAAFSASVAPSCPAGAAPSSAGSPGSGCGEDTAGHTTLALLPALLRRARRRPAGRALRSQRGPWQAALTSPGPPRGCSSPEERVRSR